MKIGEVVVRMKKKLMTHLMDVRPLRAGEFDQNQLKWHFEKKKLVCQIEVASIR